MCTLNKLPQVKPDLVRTDDNCEEWNMENLIDNLQKWLRRNKTEESGKTPNKALKLAKRAEETSNVETSGSETEEPTKRARNNPNYVESEGNLNYITSIIGIYTA